MAEAANNVVGILHGCKDASPIAERFARAGWNSTSSSWHGYEVETAWCRVQLDPVDDPDVLLNGVIAPERFNNLAALLAHFGLRHSLELYDENHNLIREIHT
ncbi:hypothetical protein ACI3K4_25140 [Streptomyces sp. CSMPJR101]|uniref:hypothetical protein n=1 Tax=Streptomyces sp. CSMPJR101 TaxID=1279378 RepID=UPI003854B31D